MHPCFLTHLIKLQHLHTYKLSASYIPTLKAHKDTDYTQLNEVMSRASRVIAKTIEKTNQHYRIQDEKTHKHLFHKLLFQKRKTQQRSKKHTIQTLMGFRSNPILCNLTYQITTNRRPTVFNMWKTLKNKQTNNKQQNPPKQKTKQKTHNKPDKQPTAGFSRYQDHFACKKKREFVRLRN